MDSQSLLPNISVNNDFTLFFQNTSGIRTKINSIYEASSTGSYDAFVFVETWLNSNFSDTEIFDPNIYKVFRKDRDSSSTGRVRGGGVLVAIKSSFIVRNISLHIQDPLLDQLCLCISVDNSCFFICVSYIPPNSPDSLYIAHTNNITSIMNSMSENDNICILGDFNLTNISWSIDYSPPYLTPISYGTTSECYFIDNLLGSDLVQINNYHNKNGKLLDLIFINININYHLNTNILTFIPCDNHHIPLELSINSIKFSKIPVPLNSCVFNYKLCDTNSLMTAFMNIPWELIFANTDISLDYSNFCDIFLDLCKAYIPMCTPSTYKIPWHTKNLKKLKNCRNKYRRLFLNTGLISFRELYRFYMRKLNCLSRILYKNYLSKIENKVKSDPKEFWRFVNSKKSCSPFPSQMFLNDEVSTDLNVICNLFASFFKSNFIDINSDPLLNDCSTNSQSQEFYSVLNLGYMVINEEDVLWAIQQLNNSKKVDIDGFCPFIIKNLSSVLIKPLCIIFNKSLRAGIFLDRWKISIISPIHKKGNKSDISNYRPISKLSTISKLFERIIMSKFSFYVKQLICPNQHGFVKSRSTVTNLSLFVNFCYNSFSNKSQVHTIYTDFSKAFDRVSHSILLQKLFKLGFHSSLLQWIRSYISDRRCFVEINGHRSLGFIATSGVPQGSILGPLLFTLFINDIVHCFINSECLLYADDLKIFRTVSNLQDALLLQADIDRLSSWCDSNCLSLNVSKCFCMSYSKCKTKFMFNYNIDNCPLQYVDYISDLGVIFDPGLTFQLHINQIIPKSLSVISFIRRHSTSFSDPYTLKTLYISLVRSKLEYASFIWNPTYDSHIIRLERIQRVFTKFALRSLNLNHTPSYISRNALLGLDSLEVRRNYLSLLFIRDIISGEIDCPHLLQMINFSVPPRLTRHSNIFSFPQCSTNYALNEPITRTVRYYNYLSKNFLFDFTLSKSCFKSQLLNCIRCKY